MISNAFSENGAVERSATSLEDQSLAPKCGSEGAIEAIKEISTPPAPAKGRKALFITDDELRAAGVPEIDIDALNFNERTQKGKATRPTDKRYLPAVKEVLAARGVTVELK